MGSQPIIDVDQFCPGANGGNRGTGIDAHLIHWADIDHQSGASGPSGITVTAGPCVNGDIAAAGKIKTGADILGRLATRHGARTNAVETCVENFSIGFEGSGVRKQKFAFQATLKARPLSEVSVSGSATRNQGRRQTAQNEVSSFHGRRPSWTVPLQ